MWKSTLLTWAPSIKNNGGSFKYGNNEILKAVYHGLYRENYYSKIWRLIEMSSYSYQFLLIEHHITADSRLFMIIAYTSTFLSRPVNIKSLLITIFSFI
jgi:hypothetical protein